MRAKSVSKIIFIIRRVPEPPEELASERFKFSSYHTIDESRAFMARQ
jgi:hypothetical protein